LGFKSKKVKDRIRRNASYFNDLITRSVYNSNAIEGNTLSYFETYSLLCKYTEYIINSRTVREIYEAINLKYALDYTIRNIDKEITAEMIIKVAKFINKGILDINSFRECCVSIKGSQHIPPSPIYIRNSILELLYNYYKSTDDIDYKIAKFHIDFERIHPFQDGNGRTGRVFILKEYLKNEMLPPVITVEQRTLYIDYLDRYNIEGLANLLKNNREFEESRYNSIKQ